MEQEVKRIIIAGIAAAAAGLTACTDSAAPTAAPASSKSVVRVPVSCSQQYRAWTDGHGKGLVNTVAAVSSAATAGEAHMLTAALTKARPAVALAAQHPMPGCADPRGYWDVLLRHLNAAASASSASSRQAAMKGVPPIQHQLTSELKQTTQ